MFCPKCASQNVEGASFCRSCGANISLIPQALSGQLPYANPPRAENTFMGRSYRRTPSVENAIRSIATGVLFAVMAIIIGKFAAGGAHWWFWLLIPAASLFIRGASDLARCRVNRAPAPTVPQPQLNSLRQPDLPAPKTGELLTPVPSVTEGTTRHLATEAQTRHFDSHQNQPS